jgi:hypothetical protein
MFRRLFRVMSLAALMLAVRGLFLSGQTSEVQFVFTSDQHYEFRGATDVDAHVVNAAMVAKMNTLATASFPSDAGVRAGTRIGAFDFIAIGGDIANRSEVSSHIQSASASWAQFTTDYIDTLKLPGRTATTAALFVVPGNHDVSNAIGFYKAMQPTTDASVMVGIFNRMMQPAVLKTPATYHYTTDRVLTSRDIGGVHVVFLNVWPDSVGRAWMEADLARVSSSTPVILFTRPAGRRVQASQ